MLKGLGAIRGRIVAFLGWIVSICGRIVAAVAFCGGIVSIAGRRRRLITIHWWSIRRRGRLVAIDRRRISVRGGWRIVAVRRRIVGVGYRVAITPVQAFPIADFLSRRCNDVE